LKIFIASDHAGFYMKKHIVEFLRSSDFEVGDLGTDSDAQCDYPVFANILVDCVLERDFCKRYGILICGTGVGMSIVANRNVGIRAALCFNEEMAAMARRHNDANVLVLGARVVTNETAIRCAKSFLATEFEGGRHDRRLRMIDG
jgi:ribose 5-phosphate isomerase B